MRLLSQNPHVVGNPAGRPGPVRVPDGLFNIKLFSLAIFIR